MPEQLLPQKHASEASSSRLLLLDVTLEKVCGRLDALSVGDVRRTPSATPDPRSKYRLRPRAADAWSKLPSGEGSLFVQEHGLPRHAWIQWAPFSPRRQSGSRR